MTCFTNIASCDRIIYTVVSALNKRWEERLLSRDFTQKT